MSQNDPLKARLFGYGVPYKVSLDNEGRVEAVPTNGETEARELSESIKCLLDNNIELGSEAGGWAYSMPFGRCGLDGLPREYLKVHHCSEAYLDRLSLQGLEVCPLRSGETVRIDPGSVVRLRAKPQAAARVLVAFQTEDRTPLAGHAAPFTMDGEVPDDYAERLRKCHLDFAAMQQLLVEEESGFRAVLNAFFGRMAVALKQNPAVEEARLEARDSGAYDADNEVLFERQERLLTPEVVQRIAEGEEGLFRFPGMFGGVAPLFGLL